MKVIYDKKAQRFDLISDTLKFCVAFITNDELVFDCATIKLDIATKLFQRWHQIERDEPEFIARALNDALNSELTVWINDCSTPVYHGSCFDSEMIRAFICDNSELVSDEFHFNLLSVKHNITEDRVEYFIDDKLKGWLPIIRKEIAS